MCGLVGEVLFDGSENSRNLSRELNLLAHRGPNDRGQWSEGPCVLGHVRLSILDLSPAGHQPFQSRCGRWQLVFNGEIYNYLELKKHLESQGVMFRTQTDTEVLLEWLLARGWEGLHDCNGMWALALWDSQDRKLLLARDRFGIKPLYLRHTKNSLRFASEIKALWDPGEFPRANRPYLYHFIDRQEGFQNKQTVYQEITKILPGHCLTVESGKLKERAWYQLPGKQSMPHSFQDRQEQFREILTDAVRLRLRSDVPVGICLSGGLDSSVITGIVSKILKVPVTTFSSVYQEPGYCEKNFVDDVNLFCQTTSYQLTPQITKFEEILRQLIMAHDRPVRMPGTYSHWHVMKCAADHATVLLDGQGADELLGGYRYFYPLAMQGWWQRGWRGDFKAWQHLYQSWSGIQKYLPQSGLGRAFLAEIWQALVHRDKKEKPRWQDRIVVEKFKQEGRQWQPQEIPQTFSEPLNNSLYQQFMADNLPMLLDFEDRISMSWSLEARVPFLDHRLVELAFSLPVDDKINGFTSKYILRESFFDVIPQSVYQRKDKLGFPTPTEIWFRGPLKGFVESVLLDPGVDRHQFFDRAALQQLWQEHLSGQMNHERLLWRALTMELWATFMLDSPIDDL